MTTKTMWWRIALYWIALILLAVILYNGSFWWNILVFFLYGMITGLFRYHPFPFMYKRYGLTK